MSTMLTPLLLSVALGATRAPDSVVYTVYNHDRVAGSMIVWRWGDSARVRYVFTDRNRGTRVEARYKMADNDAVGIEIRTVLPDGRPGDPTSRMELFADSVRRWTPQRTTTTKVEPNAYYTMAFTP